MSNQIIDFVKCPRCEKEYIQGDLELVCAKCAPAMQMDLCLQDLLTSLTNLEQIEPELLSSRKKIIYNLHTRLKNLNKATKDGLLQGTPKEG